MFINGAAAAYKSKNGMVRFTRAVSFMIIECSQNVNSIVHDNRMFAERAFYCMKKKLREKLA